ncbi:Aste57867_652 [Aphanomyces stellatus]|uniref:Aste57867_652 protein n=1 Tax=Aphanomyces stellatus TaxID=120398 RepID=A0A485K4B8_9STRA|nr:hypothetical protein As57867_000651 [Aphanomyces stellatus]VFT77877.1 Aste57867_652 [Aphanomyces stellatus]
MGCMQSRVDTTHQDGGGQESVTPSGFESSQRPNNPHGATIKNVESWITNSNEYVAKSTVDKKIIKTLQARKKKMDDDGTFKKHTNFERVAMQFGNVEMAFMSIREIYEKHTDPARKTMNMDKFCGALSAFGVTIERPAIQDIFNESDLIRDNSLNFNEFAVSLAICYLLGVVPGLNHAHNEVATAAGGPDEEPPEALYELDATNAKRIAKAFDTVVNAYLMFDEDASGIIKWDEMKEILNKPEDSKGVKMINHKTKFFNVERWKELDWNKDGSINFQEFFLAFQKWVGVDEDEDQ